MKLTAAECAAFVAGFAVAGVLFITPQPGGYTVLQPGRAPQIIQVLPGAVAPNGARLVQPTFPSTVPRPTYGGYPAPAPSADSTYLDNDD